MNILLVGNPNVGKSLVFSRLTGAKVIASNYPGTTVEFTEGVMNFFGIKGKIIDSPGIYSLSPTNKAEEVAVKLLEKADVLVNVIDATNLERNLRLTLELIKSVKKPLLIVLNMWDETRHKGIAIDKEELEKILGLPVVTTCALSGEGIKDLALSISKAKNSGFKFNLPIWTEIGNLIEKVQKLSHKRHTLWDFFEELSIRPPFSFFVAVALVFFSFVLIRFIGEGLINHLFNPLFDYAYTPLVMKLNALLAPGSFLQTVLIGQLVDGNIDYSASFGLLTTGLYVPLGAVLPYIISFYFVLGFMEDWGYLPRLAILGDRFFHKIGLHGYAIVPMVLGLGCNVPGALANRLFQERREKFIAATLLAIAVPCMAQTAMIINLLGRFGGQYVLGVFFIIFCLWVVLGKIMNFFVKGQSPEILIEIPPYRRPHLLNVLKKLWYRISWFFKEALPLVLLGILIVNILYFFRVIDALAFVFSPVITKLWGLPKEMIGALLIGFLRKDIAVGMLRPLDLSLHQIIVGVTILAVYFPCMATFVVLAKELGLKDMIKSIIIMIFTAVSIGALLNFGLKILGI
ncbi:MAG: ferrous iron transporter B [Candidatus Omnitrophica bacterium]|nr:ferrous iron transporter B [Candidatus Omnitrophota bacterium]MDD5429342.1 ferrous iron transporter B [Candidatus Omnitrophota bacterium]